MEDENIVESGEIENLDELRTLTDNGDESTAPLENLEESEEPEYVPNYSYKVKDQELEFDELLKTAVTSKESEELLRDLHTKAAGLDSYKNKYSELEGKYGNMETQAKSLVTGYKNLRDFRDERNFHKMADAMGVDASFVTEWALALDDHNNLPEEQKMMIENSRRMEAKLASMEQQMNNYQQTSQRELIDNQVNELKGLISSDEYSDVANVMEMVGVDFGSEVLRVGHEIYKETDSEPPVGEVVKMVSEKYSKLLDYVNNNNNQGLQQGQAQTVVQQQETLPSVKGNNSTATSEPMTFAKLLKMANN
jgi:hypothetical protein